jgi:pyruvate, water dikinase
VRPEEVRRRSARKFSITDAEVEELARYAMIIEAHYGGRWTSSGAGRRRRQALHPAGAPGNGEGAGKRRYAARYRLKKRGEVLVSGRAIGQKIGSGTVRLVKRAPPRWTVQPGDVLVTDMTDPDWEPVMKRPAAIVTNRGGRTCHAAIIARELGIPAVVGCGDATQVLREGEPVTVSCAEGDTGNVYRGIWRPK